MPASSPREKLVTPGDLVGLPSGISTQVATAWPVTATGLVLALHNGWAHVQWCDSEESDNWTQWHPSGKLSIISRP